jgi:hypothetical protein
MERELCDVGHDGMEIRPQGPRSGAEIIFKRPPQIQT